MKRKHYTNASKEVRLEVWERDNRHCIICSSPSMLTFAHFIGRGQGGLGIKENLVTLCMECHHQADNGKETRKYKDCMRNYLEELYPSFSDEERKHNKWKQF